MQIRMFTDCGIIINISEDGYLLIQKDNYVLEQHLKRLQIPYYNGQGLMISYDSKKQLFF